MESSDGGVQQSEDATEIFVHDGDVSGPLGDARAATLLEKLSAVLEGRLCAVSLPHNKLSESAAYSVSRAMSSFPQLRELNLLGNQLGYVGAAVIAQSALQRPNLASLCLAGNGIGGKDSRQLMGLLLGGQSFIRVLDLSDNRIGNDGAEMIGPFLRGNSVLEDLQLAGCQIGDTGVLSLVQNLVSNGSLRTLNLNRNPVRKSKNLTDAVRAALYRNTSLLNVFIPEVTNLSVMTDELTFLKNQNAAFRKAEMGDAGLAYFSERLWRAIPSSVFRVDTLSKLDLSSNRLTGLPYSIVRITSLEWLNISSNLMELNAVPVHCSELPHLHTLRVEGNPFVANIPSRYDWHILDDLLDFFSFFVETRLSGFEIKTLVLGAKNSGKTRLVQSLLQAGQRPDVGPAPRVKQRRSFLGRKSSLPLEPSDSFLSEFSDVSITSVALPLPDRRARLNVWEFNVEGAESHPMLQFYLSDGGFYIITVNPNAPDWRESVHYWKSLVESRVNAGDVFFVVIHKDRSASLCSSVLAEIMRDVVPTRQKQRSRPGASALTYHGAWGVSASSPKDVMPLLERMAAVASARAAVLSSMSAPWILAQTVLSEEARVISFPIISYSHFETITTSCGLLDDECSALARHMHEAGTILHYSGIKKLHDVVILDPKWLLKVASQLLQHGRKHFVNGTFSANDVPQIWPSHDFPLASYSSILRLLEAFEVLNPLGSVYVMPYLVPDQEPVDMFHPLDCILMGQRYSRVYVFKLEAQVPRTFSSQLIIRMLEISSRAFHIWQSGVVFSLAERQFTHVIAVRVDYTAKEVLIDVSTADHSGKVLHILHSTTESLLDGWYRNIQYESFAIGSDGVRISLDEVAKVSMQLKHKLNVAISEELVPDILMKSTAHVQWSEVQEGEFIAAGAFGSVSHARYRGQEVVVKRMLTLEQMSEPEMFNSFLKECWAMSFLHHECIIRLEGISLEPLCMIMEYMSLRDLRHFLDHFEPLPWSLRLKVLVDVARGMAYAHEQFPPIVHRDLK